MTILDMLEPPLSPSEQALIMRSVWDVEVIGKGNEPTSISIIASDAVEATLNSINMLYPPHEPRPAGLMVHVSKRMK